MSLEDPGLLLELAARSNIEFSKKVRKAVGELHGLEDIADCVSEEALEILEEDPIPRGALADVIGSAVISWYGQTYPELPSPFYRLQVWKALVASGRKPIDMKMLVKLLRSGEEL
ncbi:MAG: hypothetical protein GXO32_05600 [Crenarchaeota archaeon]|nr:hypothetical protein [Thermoproteota archaeon]